MQKAGFQDMKIKQMGDLPVKEYKPQRLMQSKILNCGYLDAYGSYPQPLR